MKTRAAVAWKAGAPLTFEEVDLAAPKAGEVLVEIKATGICHTDYYTLSGADPEGLFPAILGHEGAGVVLDVGAGVTSLRPGDHVIPLAQDQPVYRHSLYPGQGPDARWHLALLHWWQACAPLHGHIDFCQPYRGARNCLGQDS